MHTVGIAPAVLGRRVCAVLAASSAVLHGLMIGQAGNPAVGALMLGMLVVCLYCARDLWVAGPVRAWVLVALMNLGMIAVHWSVPDCHAVAAPVAAAPSQLMLVATTLAAAEAAIAAAVLYVLTRRRSPALLGID